MDSQERKGRWKNHPPHAQLKCIVCGNPFEVRPARAKTARYCSYKCHQSGEGRKGGMVRAGQMQAASKGKSYKKLNGRHIHRIVAENKLGRKLKPGEISHHIDTNKLNNSESNIEVVSSQSEHMKRHRKQMLAARKLKHGY